jgi:aldehyde:ferredoxin oxidoreductase
MEAIFMCQRLGLDHMTASEMINWLMTLYEKGIISAEDTDGIPMEWGSGEAILGMLKKMAFREGIGNVLAEGILPAAKAIGRNSEYHASYNRGLPVSEVSIPNLVGGLKGVALGLVVSSRGDTMEAVSPGTTTENTPEATIAMTGIEASADVVSCEGKPEFVKFTEDVIAIADSVSFCKLHTQWTSWGLVRMEDIAAFLSAGSGRAVDVNMLFDDANKVRTLEHAYLLQEGYTRGEQVLPEQYYETIKAGPLKGMQLTHEELEGMKTQYYRLRGWDENTGIPTEETLNRYGLSKVVQNLKNISG